MALESSRRARTNSLAAAAGSPWMMRPGGRGGRLSSLTTLSAGGSAARPRSAAFTSRSEEHTSELQSLTNLVCRLLLEKKKKEKTASYDQKLRNTDSAYETQLAYLMNS